MARILTGIQSSGRQHLGNLLGAIMPGIELSKKKGNESFYFIADLHSMTTIKDPNVRVYNVHAAAATWVALGFDTEANTFYRQSRIPEVCELTWYLNCLTPFPMLANAHSFKDKSDKLADVNAGLFTYPVLMAADIILYDANYVPVGKDQKQHLEMTRDIATAFNTLYGETFVLPEVLIQESVMTIPGVDGQKMSKSYKNTIDVFLPDKELLKQVKSIKTDSKGLNDPKDPDTCLVFKLYSLLATEDQKGEMRQKYLSGNYGYGHAKTELFDLLVQHFGEAREKFDYFMTNTEELEQLLENGEAKARAYAKQKLEIVRKKTGFA